MVVIFFMLGGLGNKEVSGGVSSQGRMTCPMTLSSTTSFILTSGSSGSCSLSVDQSISGRSAVGNWNGDQSTSTSGLLLLAAGSRAGGRTSVVAWSCGGGRSSVVLLVAAEGSCASATESASGISGLIGSGSFI